VAVGTNVVYNVGVQTAAEPAAAAAARDVTAQSVIGQPSSAVERR